jgi:coenzyme F420-reducing hydrogenase delta subunit
MSVESEAVTTKAPPRILVFSTAMISDIGIDLAGSTHLHYPPSVVALPVACSSGIRPDWILHALDNGFDGVFIAADGTDCPYLSDCTDRTAKIASRVQDLMRERGMQPERVKMAAICSVCSEAFVRQMQAFSGALAELQKTGEEG